MTFLFLFSIAIFGAARAPEDEHNICLSEPLALALIMKFPTSDLHFRIQTLVRFHLRSDECEIRFFFSVNFGYKFGDNFFNNFLSDLTQYKLKSPERSNWLKTHKFYNILLKKS